MSELPSKDSSSVSCQKCERHFTAKKNLYVHIRKFHPEENIDIARKQACGICFATFRNIKELQDHISESHEVKLHFENKVFYCNSDFKDWKRKIEHDSKSLFVVKSGCKKAADKTIQYYFCHRSGTRILKKERKRRLKCDGSIKTGSTCPASMKVTTETHEEATQIDVEFQSVHVGHETQVCKLRIAKEDRNKIAEMLKFGIAPSKVLQIIHAQFSPTDRLGLITLKDLHNISRDFKINQKVLLSSDDILPVDAKVKKMIQDTDNPVLVYKPMGELLNDYSDVNKEVFLLGIMNEAQVRLLDLYGNNIVMLLCHDSSIYGFQLTTLMIKDENNEGFPVAILYSTHVSWEILIPFFREIKNKLPSLKTKIFMTNENVTLYHAWEKVFGETEFCFLSTWHVARKWNRILNFKVKNTEVKDAIRKELTYLLNEVNKVTFGNMFKNLIEKFKPVKEAKWFIGYISRCYGKRPETWANCHRVECGIDTNMKFERWNRQLECKEGHKEIRNLDKSLSVALTLIAEMFLGRIGSAEADKLKIIKTMIQKRHKKSLEEMKDYIVSAKTLESWIVTKSSESSTEIYEIRKSRKCDCNITCEDCQICIHSLTCTCLDHCIRFMVCKHIHFLCQNFKSELSSSSGAEKSALDNFLLEHEHKSYESEDEENLVISQMMQKTAVQNAAKQKCTLLEKWRTIHTLLEALESPDAMRYVEESMNNIITFISISEK